MKITLELPIAALRDGVRLGRDRNSSLRMDNREADPAMRDLLLQAKEGFRMADSTDSLFLMQLVSEDSRRLKKWDLAQFATVTAPVRITTLLE